MSSLGLLNVDANELVLVTCDMVESSLVVELLSWLYRLDPEKLVARDNAVDAMGFIATLDDEF